MGQLVLSVWLRRHLLLVALVCSLLPPGCRAIATLDACHTSADCPHTMVCATNICRDTCHVDSDCGAAFACAEEICLPLNITGDAAAPDLARPPGTSDAAAATFSPASDGAATGDAGNPSAIDAAIALDAAPAIDAAPAADAGPTTCTAPRSCGSAGLQCGVQADGCGGTIDCGGCGSPHFCGADGTCHMLQLGFRPVAAGSFTMGSSTSEPGRDGVSGVPVATLDETQHLVQLTHGFEIADSEVTQRDFADVMGYNPSLLADCGGDCPVERLSWHEAAAFCNALSQSRGLPLCFECSGAGRAISCTVSTEFSSPYLCAGFRLPTEAEWEYAARATSQTATYLGDLAQLGCRPADSTLNQIAWYLGDATSPVYSGGVDLVCDGTATLVGTHPVRSKSYANGYGLYDMIGNVWEWVLDCQARYPATSQRDPVGPLVCGGSDRIVRGCAADSLAAQCRSAERTSWPCGSDRCWNTGFRPVRTTGW